LAFLLALFAIVRQVSPGTEIEVPPSLVRLEPNRFQAIGTTLHICAFCFVSRPRRRIRNILASVLRSVAAAPFKETWSASAGAGKPHV
jgi:hypothetical protein